MSKHIIHSGVFFDGNHQEIIEKINQLNKKLTHMGMPPSSVHLGSSSFKEMTIGTPAPRKIRNWRFIVKGSLPEINGWLVHGVIEAPNKEGEKNFVRNFAKDRKIPFDDLRKCEIQCGECQSERKRNRVYLLSDKSGEIKTIGEQCLETTFGFQPTKAIKLMDLYTSLARDLFSLSSEKGITSKITDDTYLNLEDFMKHVLCAVHKKGYVTAKEGSQPTGKTAMLAYLNGPQLSYTGSQFNQMWGNYDAYKAFYDDQGLKAQEIVTWAKSQEGSGNTYLNNLSKIANDNWVSIRHVNMAASMYHAFESRKFDASQEKGTLREADKHEGVALHVRCAYIDEVNTKHGKRFLHKLFDEEKNGYGIFSDHIMMNKGSFYNIIADLSSPKDANKMNNNLIILRNIKSLELSSLDAPPPSGVMSSGGECQP